jgi:molecular chaperone DnaK (HSP70)
LIGEFTLSGIQYAKKHIPKIEVTFALDVNGILNVTALDKQTRKQANITIRGHGGLS